MSPPPPPLGRQPEALNGESRRDATSGSAESDRAALLDLTAVPSIVSEHHRWLSSTFGSRRLRPLSSLAMTAGDRVRERRKAAALARHYRDEESLSIAEIARRLGRADATVKAYL
jgi:hypothetical protein